MEMRKSGTGDEMRCSGERMRWRWRGDGLSSGDRWCFIKVPVMEEEARG
jgi:hypothetical protein